MTLPKIDNLDIPSLRQLTEVSENRVCELEEAGRRSAIERLTAEVEALGYDTLEKLTGIRHRGRPKNGNRSTQHEKEHAL